MSSIDDLRDEYLNNPDLLSIFQRQVLFQCHVVVAAAAALEESLATDNGNMVWISIQNLLTGAANISKALWGQGGRLTTEREPLRASLGITDASPMRSVTMRNNFEHFDERLDKWWRTTENFNYIDMQIGLHPRWGNLAFQSAEKDIFREFDPATGDLVFWGQRFNLREIVHEAQVISQRIVAELNKHFQRGSSPRSSGSGQ